MTYASGLPSCACDDGADKCAPYRDGATHPALILPSPTLHFDYEVLDVAGAHARYTRYLGE